MDNLTQNEEKNQNSFHEFTVWLLTVVVVFLVNSYLFMISWNLFAKDIFDFPEMTFINACGLYVFKNILLLNPSVDSKKK